MRVVYIIIFIIIYLFFIIIIIIIIVIIPHQGSCPRVHLFRPATERHIHVQYCINYPSLHRLRAERISSDAMIYSAPSLSGTLSRRAPWPETHAVSMNSSSGLQHISVA